MAVFDVVTKLGTEVCVNCGMTFAMPLDFQNRRRDDHASFCCPMGHSQHYAGKSETEKLRDELTRERARLDQEKALTESLSRSLTFTERQVSARKAVATKLRKRIAAGKCPCCHAQFKDLKTHMKAQHPSWNPEQAAEAIAAKTEG